MGPLKIAMSGTYSTGKTTTSYALSLISGIPRTHALTMREILPIILPGKRLEDCNPYDLYELGVRRFTERVLCESKLPDGFISDGSALHEWVYGSSRMKTGINPDEKGIRKLLSQLALLPYAVPFKDFNEHYGKMVKAYTLNTYNYFIHLPVEFPITHDGHRPVSEEFRMLSDQYLMETIKELKIPYVVASGSLEKRIETLINHFKIEPKMSIEEAIQIATTETKKRNQMDIEFNKKRK